MNRKDKRENPGIAVRREADEVIRTIKRDKPNAIAMVGVGPGWEVATLAEAFNAPVYGCDPIHPFPIVPREITAVFDRVAISDRDGEMRFYHCPIRLGSSGKYPRHFSGEREITVPCTTLDAFYQKHDLFNKSVLLWIDCEGSEMDAFKCGTSALASTSWVHIEVRKRASREGFPLADDVERVLIDNGFVLKRKHDAYRRVHTRTYKREDAA